MGMENSTVRTMRYIVKNCDVGDTVYAYQIAKAIDVEPQQMTRVFKRWSNEKNGFLEDRGKIAFPEGLRSGPPPRVYAITAIGLEHFRNALSQLAKK